jgi:DNA adenine methylase
MNGPPPAPQPFVAWSGTRIPPLDLVRDLLAVPAGGVLREPFLGGGVVALDVLARQPGVRAVLTDRSRLLVDIWRAVQSEVDAVVELLRDHAWLHEHHAGGPEAYRIEVRGQRPTSLAERAARGVYLNRTRKGQMPTPEQLADDSALLAAADLLVGADIHQADALAAMEGARPGDVVYLDPPYLRVTGEGPRRLDLDGFALTPRDQEAVARKAQQLVLRGCHVVVVNPDNPDVRSMYHDFRHERIEVESLRVDGTGYDTVAEVLFHWP